MELDQGPEFGYVKFLIYEMHSFSFLATSLSHSYTKAKKTAEERYEHFHGLCILRGRELVDKWWKESTEPYQKGSEWHSAYRLKEQKDES